MEQQTVKRAPRRRTPFQRNRRLQGEMLTWLLIGCILVFTVLSIITPDREFSESENRSLAQFPKFGSSFLSDLGTYVADQFPGRDLWMRLNLKMNQLLGQKEASGVYLCMDDYLIQIPGSPNWDQVERNMEAVNGFAAAYPDIRMTMCVAPNAITVLSDKLPENAPARNQGEDLAKIQDMLEGVTFVDVTKTLKRHNSQYLYYKTDHHWTSLAAAYAYGELAPVMNLYAPELSTYEVYTVSKTFEGTLSSKSGSHAARDTVEIYVPQTNIDYYVSYPNGTDIGSFYNRAALDQKDHYTVFFGGNHSRVDITTTADTGRSLLIFKDSYANCLVPLLYPYFDHITMVDPRYYYDNIDLVIRSEAVTDVLYLYNLDTFLGDTSLADVLAVDS